MSDARGETLSSEWSLLSNVALEDFKAAANDGMQRAIRFHMHEERSKQPSCDGDFLQLLASCTHSLSDSEAETLRTEGHSSCPVCLADFEGHDEIIFLPCDGQHAGHWSCILPWLQEAATCPQCRFALPAEGSADHETSRTLIQNTRAAVSRLQSAVCVVCPTDPFKGKSPPRRAVRPQPTHRSPGPRAQERDPECANNVSQ